MAHETASTTTPSREAMMAAVELEILAALGKVQTIAIGRIVEKAIAAALAAKAAEGEPEPWRLKREVAEKCAADLIESFQNHGSKFAAPMVTQWLMNIHSFDNTEPAAEGEKPEPVAWRWRRGPTDRWLTTTHEPTADDLAVYPTPPTVEPLYTSPPDDDAAALQRLADMRHKADMRAIKRWQEAYPAKELVWPDHADLCVWLLEQLDATSPNPPDDGGRAEERAEIVALLNAKAAHHREQEAVCYEADDAEIVRMATKHSHMADALYDAVNTLASGAHSHKGAGT